MSNKTLADSKLYFYLNVGIEIGANVPLMSEQRNDEYIEVSGIQSCQFKCYSETNKLVQGIRITVFFKG